jgi:hypothetical protein
VQVSRKSPGTRRGAMDPSEGDPEGPARAGGERRNTDRRNRPTAPWKDLFSPLRRAHGRRASDQKGYVDRYSKRDVALLFAIFTLNIADAYMTMLWLHRGGREANPIMEFFLDIGPVAFLAQKCLIVGFWLILLLVHKNFRFAKVGLYASLAVYALLLIVHFSIVALGIEPPPRDTGAAGLEPAATRYRSLAVPGRAHLPSTQAFAIGERSFSLNRTGGRPAAE